MALSRSDLNSIIENENIDPSSTTGISEAVSRWATHSIEKTTNQRMAELSKRFPWVLKNWKRKQIVYDGDQSYLAETVDPYHAQHWYNENKKYKRDVQDIFFGDKEVFTFYCPSYDNPHDPENTKSKLITPEFAEYLWMLASNKVLKEKNFRVWQDILNKYELYEIEHPDPVANEHYFVLKLETVTANNKKRDPDITDAKELSREQQPLKEAERFTYLKWMSLTEIKELVAMKEFLEGKIKFKPFNLKWKVIETPYTNATLTTQYDPTQTLIKVFGHYTTSIRYSMFWEEKYYKQIRPGNTLQPRQRIAKLHTGWVTTIVAPRRWGKSYWAIDEAVERFTSDTQDRSKPIRVLFVGINTKKLKTVIKYLLSFTKKFTAAGYFDREASKNIMHYRSKADNKKATEQDDLGTIEFIWSKDEDAWVGDYADLIIIDECERIAENVWEDIMPIITNEWARCILISTLNKNSQKTWFYNQLVQWETEELQRNIMKQDVVSVIRYMRNKWVIPVLDKVEKIKKETGVETPFEEWIDWIDIDAMSSDMRYMRQWVGLRFTGEDNDIKTDREKTFARDRLRWTKAYYPEWWAIFPEDTGVYDYEWSLRDKDYFDKRKYKYVVLAYDPAESKDKAALVYMGYDHIANKIEIFKTDKLPNNYTYHWPFIANALKECQQRLMDIESLAEQPKEHRVFFAYDFNGVGQWLEPFFLECKVRIDMKMRFTGQWLPTKKGNNHNVPKEYLVNMLQNAMDHWAMIINGECKEFIEELDHYKSYYNSDTGNTKYQAEYWASDDFVSAAMIGTYFILDYMGEKYNITKNEIEQIVEENETFSVDKMYEDIEKIVMKWLNEGKTVQQVVDEYNWSSQRNNLKRQDILSQFWY